MLLCETTSLLLLLHAQRTRSHAEMRACEPPPPGPTRAPLSACPCVCACMSQYVCGVHAECERGCCVAMLAYVSLCSCVRVPFTEPWGVTSNPIPPTKSCLRQ